MAGDRTGADMTLYTLADKHNDDSENELRWVKPVHTETAELCIEHESLLHSDTSGLRECDLAFGMDWDRPCRFSRWLLVRDEE